MTRAPQQNMSTETIAILGEVAPGYEEILTSQALEFLTALHRKFNGRRKELLARRERRQKSIDQGEPLGFLESTEEIRRGDWKVAPVPQMLQKRNVEITGPVSRNMIINALNSGADCFMADFEDATSPTWTNIIEGQINLRDAIRRQIDFEDKARGKWYRLNPTTATLLVRPRGWHLDEKHLIIDGEMASGGLVDFGLYFFHNARELLNRGAGPYFYLPKLESHLEARLWNDVFIYAQERMGVEKGSIKATVLIETIHAAFEMDEILYELRDHSAGLNAGRWDYIFSCIKTFRNRNEALMPDRAQVTMTVPFMRAYTELLVKTCHRRGAHAMGGMAAFIPSRDPDVNERAMKQVTADKERESMDGFDGTWVAHPALVSVAREPFDKVLKGKPHQKDRMRDDVNISAKDLLNFEIPNSTITESGMRLNINVGIQYIASWLSGQGAAAIFNLMEDVATAEISRSQIWQWLHREDARLDDGRAIDNELYTRLVDEEMNEIRSMVGADRFERGKFKEARKVFDMVAQNKDFPEFLTLIAYEELT